MSLIATSAGPRVRQVSNCSLSCSQIRLTVDFAQLPLMATRSPLTTVLARPRAIFSAAANGLARRRLLRRPGAHPQLRQRPPPSHRFEVRGCRRAAERKDVVDDLDGSLGSYLDDWLERRRPQLRPTTQHSYQQLIRCYLQPMLGEVQLRELDRRILERAYARLLASGGRSGRPLSTKTVQYCHGVLRRALEDAVLDGLLETNPARIARPPRRAPDDDEFDDDLQVWTGAQAADFLAFVDDDPLQALWHLALGTGARRGELLGLRWVDVDLDAGQIRIRRSLSVIERVPRLLGTKTSRSRSLSIGSSVVEALRRHRDHEQRRHAAADTWDNRWGLVFTGVQGEPIDPMQVTTAFRDLVRRAPVPVIRLHDLRHSHASLLLSVNVPIKVVSERLGHTTIAMTMDVYGHVLPAMDTDAATRLDDLLHG
jgi:integrase